MLAYYGYTISPNQIETVEGFLICRNVPIARVGEMEYLESELIQGGDRSKMVRVLRSPDEVFSDKALSSFEGKPITDNHPPELVTPDTYSMYAKGHAQNVRKGEDNWEGYVIADLHIQDESLIAEVQSGKREISCGYECSYMENGDGTYSQQSIRGNHIAVVTRGRAGKNVAILDSDNRVMAARQPERKGNMKKSVLKLFAQAVKGASPEELETMTADAAAALEEGAETKGPATEPAKETPPKEVAKDAQSLDSKLDMILQMLGKTGAPEAPAAPLEQDVDPLAGLLKKLTGADPAMDEEAKVIPAEDPEEASGTVDRALMAEVVKKIRPAIAGIKDAADRKAVADALIACMSDDSVSDIAKITQTAQKNAARLTDQKPGLDVEAYQSAYDAMNPHKKNGGTK